MNTSFVKPSLGAALKAGAIAGVIASVANLIVLGAGSLLDTMKIPFPAVLIFSILGLIVGSLVYWVLTRVAGARAPRIFMIVSIVFLVLYAFAPVNAMSSPPVPGAEPFNFATMIAAQIMHVVAGVLAILRIPRAG
jgi:hypothetical protein